MIDKVLEFSSERNLCEIHLDFCLPAESVLYADRYHVHHFTHVFPSGVHFCDHGLLFTCTELHLDLTKDESNDLHF